MKITLRDNHDIKTTYEVKIGGSVVVDFLLIVTPIVGVCNCFMFLYVTLCPFWFCEHLDGEEGAG